MSRRTALASMAGLLVSPGFASRTGAASSELPSFEQLWSIVGRDFFWHYSLEPSRRMVGISSNGSPTFDVHDAYTGEIVWSQEAFSWPQWIPVSEQFALYGWNDFEFGGLALLDPETNDRTWERHFSGGAACLDITDEQALIGYLGGLSMIHVGDGTTIWDVPWDGQIVNSNRSIKNSVMTAAWQGDDSSQIATATDLKSGQELWRVEVASVDFNAIPDVMADFGTHVVVSQSVGLRVLNLLDALTAVRIADGEILWTRHWSNTAIAGKSDQSIWIVTADAVLTKLNLATGVDEWTVSVPVNGPLYGDMPDEQSIVLYGDRGLPGIWVFDAVTGDLRWSDPFSDSSAWWGMTNSILITRGSQAIRQYRLADLATGERVLRSGTMESIHFMSERRILIAKATEIEVVDETDGSLIDLIDLSGVVPASASITNFGDCGDYIGMTVSTSDFDDNEAWTFFLDKETLQPVAVAKLPSDFVLDTFSTTSVPLFFKSDPFEVIGVG